MYHVYQIQMVSAGENKTSVSRRPALAKAEQAHTCGFILYSCEINGYQKQIKVISITSEMIPAYIFSVAFWDQL